MKQTIFGIIIGATLLSGCAGNKEKMVVGKWTTTSQSIISNLNLTEDHKWNSSLEAGANKVDQVGTWKLTDKTVLIHLDTINGKTPDLFIDDVAKQIKQGEEFKTKMKDMMKDRIDQTFTLADDGKTMTTTDPVSKTTVTLTKVETK